MVWLNRYIPLRKDGVFHSKFFQSAFVTLSEMGGEGGQHSVLYSPCNFFIEKLKERCCIGQFPVDLKAAMMFASRFLNIINCQKIHKACKFLARGKSVPIFPCTVQCILLSGN
jgi:hypothetical protein